jgi:hypothetical protein
VEHMHLEPDLLAVRMERRTVIVIASAHVRYDGTCLCLSDYRIAVIKRTMMTEVMNKIVPWRPFEHYVASRVDVGHRFGRIRRDLVL